VKRQAEEPGLAASPHVARTATPPGDASAAGPAAEERSLLDDVELLIDDGKTYLEAELAYQKTRALFVAANARSVFAFGALAAAFAVLALFGLTVGAIIALAPLLTPWGASALVVGLLILGALGAAAAAKRRWQALVETLDLSGGDGA
jgi:hypothetical protein